MNPLVKTALRYALIVAGIQIVSGLLGAFSIDYENPSPFVTIPLLIFGFVVIIAAIPLAHIEFQKQSGNKISFGEAIGIGYIIIGVSLVVMVVMTFVIHAIAPPPNSFGVEISASQQAMAGFFSQLLVYSAILFFIILFEAQWKLYTKAGKPGWATIVPIYNVIVLLEIVRKPMFWFVLLLIPVVNIVFAIWVVNLLSRRFGKDEGFTVGMILLPFVFYPILGFGSATYNSGELVTQPA